VSAIRLPAPLIALLLVALLEGLAWMVAMPPFQGPDEGRHVAYVQKVAEAHTIPWRSGHGPETVRRLSREADTAALWSGLGPAQGNVGAKPAWTGLDQRLWRARDAALPPEAGKDGGWAASFVNPPLYYLYAAAWWAPLEGSSLFARIQAARAASLPALLAVVGLTWLIAGELLGPALLPRTLATGLVALHPQLGNMAATVNPDLFLAALSAAALWAMLRLLRLGPSAGRVAVLAGLCAAAALTHGRGLAPLAPAALAVVFAWRRRATWLALGAALAGGVAVLVYAASGAGSVRQFLSYLWQFYLPRLPGMSRSIGPPGYGVREAFVDRFFGTFAGLEVAFPSWALDVLALLSALGLVALVVVLVRRRAALAARRPVAVVLAAAVLAVLVVLHLSAYRSLLGAPGDPIVAGRYLLPLIALGGVAAAAVVRELPRRVVPYAAGALLAGAAIAQLGALGLVVERFGA
jgi:hypothetical protein